MTIHTHEDRIIDALVVRGSLQEICDFASTLSKQLITSKWLDERLEDVWDDYTMIQLSSIERLYIKRNEVLFMAHGITAAYEHRLSSLRRKFEEAVARYRKDNEKD